MKDSDELLTYEVAPVSSTFTDPATFDNSIDTVPATAAGDAVSSLSSLHDKKLVATNAKLASIIFDLFIFINC